MAEDGDPLSPVGYKRPPVAHRFRPGRSGNPKGRPKEAKNFATVIQDELQMRILVTENGKRKLITKRQAIAKQLVNKAATGDPKTLSILLGEARLQERDPEAATAADVLNTDEDALVIASILQRVRDADRGQLPVNPEPSSPRAPAASLTGDTDVP